MRRFLLRTSSFLLIGGILYILFQLYVLPGILVYAFGINTEDQIAKSFRQASTRDYSCLILGNSKMYCGINPDMFEVPAYNFAHNNDSYNQMYHKLLWVLKQNKVPDILIIGTDFFQFSVFSDSRNAYYGPYLGNYYLLDYEDKKASFWQETKELLKPYRLRTLLNVPYKPNSLKDNGQYVRVNSSAEMVVQKRNFKLLAIQLEYLTKLLDTCQARSIKVFMVMPPLRLEEKTQVSDSIKSVFNQKVLIPNQTKMVYLDFSTDNHFTEVDFIDMSHLNQKAADRFSNIINKKIIHVTAKEIF